MKQCFGQVNYYESTTCVIKKKSKKALYYIAFITYSKKPSGVSTTRIVPYSIHKLKGTVGR